ncbi:hypothetical protein OJ997_21475 [Solirubrobacter phytolaccae]|uniref:Uncharacterized protein n=1 Tax=Solirubrobacter phytolaccae TaxID=1404360 RepID=A0A9X3SGZ8_9ACTN|nr:hypothetical protein [Solirubrobacter phytolaccae]MDA0182897.1 hypothetical protein [Solirubrobacter phytolaccae]
MAGLIEFSRDVIWYSTDGPYRDVLRGAQAYLDDDPDALDDALGTGELLLDAIDTDLVLHLLRALDRSVVRLMAELINSAPTQERDDQLDHYAELRSMIRAETALREAASPEPPP